MQRASSPSLAGVEPGWAWAPYEPSPQMPWTRERAAHLFRRAAFGADWAMLERALNEGPAATVDRLLQGGEGGDSFYAEARRAVEPLLGAPIEAGHLPAWWLHVMLRTPHPLLEKITLFWHGHFATSSAKVTDPRLMYGQNALLREHALGSFRPMLHAMAKDAAMLIWLDSAVNRKAHPNENFAREVMELFCLGLGHYTEQDIKQAARSFTGWEVRRGRFFFNPYQHDSGEKLVLGTRGPFNGEDVLQILLEQPAAAEFLTGKLYRYLVSETLPGTPELLAPLAEGYRQRDYDTAWLVGTILRSNLFFSDAVRRTRVKGPVELAVGLLRALEATVNTYALAEDLAPLGQALFAPPNVKGWDGGTEWINSSTLLGRANLVWSLVGGSDARYGNRVPLERLAALQGMSEPVAMARRLAELLLGQEPPEAVSVQLAAVAADRSITDYRLRLARLVHAVATLPEYQLA
jgi:hypothetical protein